MDILELRRERLALQETLRDMIAACLSDFQVKTEVAIGSVCVCLTRTCYIGAPKETFVDGVVVDLDL